MCFFRDADLTISCPKGGYFIWIELVNFSESECNAIFDAIREQSVVVLEGSRAFYKPSIQFNSHRYLRLSYSFLSPENISDGVERIANVVLQHAKNRL